VHLPLGLSLGLLLVRPIMAQTRPLPTFDTYPVGSVGSTAKAPLQLERGSVAWYHRTVLQGDYQVAPVNFAGHYVVLHWGCGTDCQQLAIVDASTGIVHVPPALSEQLFEVRPDSRLLITNPPAETAGLCRASVDTMPTWFCNTYSVYYLWDGTALVPLDSVQAGRDSLR
jgi:hypothetical protein